MGVPIFQVPTDIYIYQSLLWLVRPSLVIETGVAKGGSILAIAGLMELMRCSSRYQAVSQVGTSGSTDWEVVGVDLNEVTTASTALKDFSFASHVTLIQGSSTEPKVVSELEEIAARHQRVLLFLDSDHTEEHVLKELRLLSPLVTIGSFVVVWDSGIGRLSPATHDARPRRWSAVHHPGTAVQRFLAEVEGARTEFVLETSLAEPLGISSIQNGMLRRRA
jgi:cephalosporin hydroxylase